MLGVEVLLVLVIMLEIFIPKSRFVVGPHGSCTRGHEELCAVYLRQNPPVEAVLERPYCRMELEGKLEDCFF